MLFRACALCFEVHGKRLSKFLSPKLTLSFVVVASRTRRARLGVRAPEVSSTAEGVGGETRRLLGGRHCR